MEKGSFRRRLQEGADNLPSLGALSRAFSDKIRQLDVKQVARIMGIAAVVGVPAYALYEVSGLFSSPTPPPRAADNPNFAGPTALSLRPKVSEALTTAVSEARNGVYDNNRLLAENIDPYHPNSHMNYGIAACKTAAATIGEGNFFDGITRFLSPRVAEAAPLEAGTPKEFIECIKGIEKQRPFLSRFGVN